MAAFVAATLAASGIAGADPAESDLAVITILLPSWTDTPQQIDIPAEAHLSAMVEPSAGDPSEPAEESPESLPDGARLFEVSTPDALEGPSAPDKLPIRPGTTAHLLMPQDAPPVPSSVRFHLSSPAGDIWLQGLVWIVEGETSEKEDRPAEAIQRYQNARSAYQEVADRFPEWQADIVAFRLQDLERRIRRLVEETRTDSDNADETMTPAAAPQA